MMNPIEFQACLFDLDGTLVDSEVLWVQAIHDWLAAQHLPVDKPTVMQWVYGHAWSDIHRFMLERFPRLERDASTMAAQVRPVFVALHANVEVRIPSSLALLRQLSAHYPVAIVTGSPREDAEQALDRAGIRAAVRFMLTSEDYAPGKPDPAGYRMAADRLGLPPETCLVFEDSAAGVRSAKAAGMRCVALARPGRPPQDVRAADLILSDLADFPWTPPLHPAGVGGINGCGSV